ncbi:MAG: class I SAM-dependent rRNA methyltransferase [Polyangia bacterium]
MQSAEPLAPAATGTDVLLSPRGAARLRRGGGLVARVDIVTPPLAMDADVVRLRDGRGQFLGMALWCARGPIAARLYARTEQPLDARLLRERLARADGLRRALYAGQSRDAYRVVHGEADLLPGLFVDRYGDAAVIQTATAALDRREPLVAELLRELLGVSLVVVRDDGSARDLEELPRRKGVLIGGPATRVRFHDAGSLLEADLLVDRKTGGFLDQQENHALAADYVHRLRPGGRALDAFTYHGGFALALARAGLSVTACDEDPQAVARARRNAELSGVAVDFQVHNAFDLLRSYEAGGRRFDVVVVDPPALAKRGRQHAHAPGAAQQAALRAYKELNLRAIRLVEPGGLLVTCSCSGRVSAADFGGMLDEAAADSGRVVQLLERRGAGRDHPVLCGLPESEYLKCWFAQVLSN